jgi:hypothetical protein
MGDPFIALLLPSGKNPTAHRRKDKIDAVHILGFGEVRHEDNVYRAGYA